MPSPFPGMNPYLEQEDVWHDFHESFIPLAREMLTAQVLPRYIVKIEEHLYIHELDTESRHLVGYSDVSVAQGLSEGERQSATAVLAAPVQVRIPIAVDIERLSYLEVRDRQNRQLITVLELLSPANKYAGADRDQYIAKRAQLLSSSVNVVEIDLLRGGPRMPIIDLPPCDYCVLVSRVGERPNAGLWPIRLRDRLPPIPIPLRPGEAEAKLDLQQALDHIYDAAGYGTYIYNEVPAPTLSAEDDAWARQVLSVARG